ncbi:MAG: TerB family tellurite resistance protein [Gammaproteobacteria bacterium]|nr:TerB family tellurite resistance protein [Gammaproteobacteria bacterium]MCY4210584.1 TerB family tellurite resistance protein [Gammaproteobacteria bacterium]MCY4282567.1 TerB family tellurite resistance protein [Gammaproteobacteria bacterium]
MLKSIREFFELGMQDTADRSGTDSNNRVELAAAVLMVEISLADASIDPAELAVIKATLCNHFTIPAQQVDELIDMARHEVDLAVSLHEFTRMLNDNLSAAEKIRIIEALWKVAFADAVLDKYEEYYIRKIADLLYISHKDYLMAKHRVADSAAPS